MIRLSNVGYSLIVGTLLSACGGSGSESDDSTPSTDTVPPTITLIGDSTINIELGENYEEPGITVTDNIDTNLIADVSGIVDTSTPGTYTLTYTSSDSAGNEASATRTITVTSNGSSDTEAPAISLIGNNTMRIRVGESYIEPGSSVTDNVDSDLSASISGTVDTSTAGNYILTYTATDAAGNTSSIIRTVIVEAEAPPLIEGDAYIFHSGQDDSYFMEFWGDTWGTNTEYTDQVSDQTYEKTLEISKSSEWGTVVAWGNNPENSVNISNYTHARFKVKTATFNQVQVFVQSPNAVNTEIIYNLSNGATLEDGWVEMEVALPGFTEMSWFALNFIGDSGTVLLADVYFTTQEIIVTGPPVAAPIPNQNDEDVIVLYSDSLAQDSWVSVWNANWWNAPVHAEGDINGDHFAKYVITDGGTEGGVVGLEYGFEIAPLNASSTTTWNLDLYIENGISRVSLQLVSEDGGATYNIENPTTGNWTSYAIPYSGMTDNDGGGAGVLNPGVLQSIGIQLWGNSGQAIYVDNIYFSGEANFYDLAVTVNDNNGNPLSGAIVSVGNTSASTNASGIATLSLPEGEHKIIADANGYGLTQGNQTISGGNSSLSLTVIPINPGPAVAAPNPIHSDEEATVLYSDSLVVDQFISYWSDNWWNAPTFSEVNVNGNFAAQLQIIPDGQEGGITGIQYGIADGPLDASSATRIRFNMYATSGISRVDLQVLSTSGPGLYTLDNVTTGEWITVDIPFSDFRDSHRITASSLTQLGVQLWGTTSDSVYLDNIYFY